MFSILASSIGRRFQNADQKKYVELGMCLSFSENRICPLEKPSESLNCGQTAKESETQQDSRKCSRRKEKLFTKETERFVFLRVF